MKNIIRSLSQLIFPNLCICCDGYLSHQEGLICDFCNHTLPRFELSVLENNPLSKKFWGRLDLVDISAYLNFKGSDDVRKILHQIKYKGNIELGNEMGVALGNHLLKSKEFEDIDLIIPVPLHPKRQNIRGYNQSDLLSYGVSEMLNVGVNINGVAREKYNASQTNKKRYERFINSKEIFRVSKPLDLENKHILLIDDVITTGATIEACGAALLEVEGLKLSVASLAVAY